MKNVSDLKVSQIRIFPVDVVPFHYLYAPAAKERIKSAFVFKEAGQTGPQLHLGRIPSPITFPAENLFFGQGEINFENRIYPIESLVIEPRRILTNVVGTSKVSNAFYNALTEILSEFDLDKQFASSSFITIFEETGCDVSLELDVRELLSEQLLALLSSDILPDLGSSQWEARLRGIRLGIEVSFAPKDSVLPDHDISLNPKVVVFQSASGTPINQKRYLTFTPTNSDTHLRLMEKLEKLGQSVKSKR